MKFLNICSLLAFLCLLTNYSQAQNSTATLSGQVFDNGNEPVSFANAVLFSLKDSTITKVAYTTDEGAFSMINIPAGQYWLRISFVGFAELDSEVFELSAGEKKVLPEFSLQSASNELEEVVVTATRPLLEIKPDKMVFNVEGSINASGSDALELLRKAPGIIIDNNDNISMLGRAGVRIYIDGKPSPLRGEDLANFLRTLQASEIDNIELITNPSSKYDAEGDAGIINIKLKKDVSLGANANTNLGYSVGEKARYNGTLGMNYRNKAVNAFGSYSYYDGAGFNDMQIYREQNGLVFDQAGRGVFNWSSHNFKAGLDYFLDKKQTVGVLFSGYLSENGFFNNSRTPIGVIGTGIVDSILVARPNSVNSRDNINVNVNYRFDNGEGVTWNIDADYGIFQNDGAEYQPNFYYDANEEFILSERINRTETPVDISIYTFKVDHERMIGEGKLEAGLKTALVRTDNTFDFYNILEETDFLDPNRSNQFIYEENVNAAYVNYSRQIKKLGIQMGLRVEQTNSTGELISLIATEEDLVKRNYLDFFPSAGITYSPNEKNSFRLSYGRRINRPSYQDLNPFKSQLDELTFEKGNPFLRPEYTNNIQLTHTFNYSLNTTFSYSHTRDLVVRQTDIDFENPNASFITWLNLADQYNYSLSVSSPIPVNKWWSVYTNLTGYYVENKADFGDGRIVDLNATAFSGYAQNTFQLPKDFSFEVSGWYNSPALWGGNFEMESMWSMDAGVQKKVLGGKGNLKISVSDIFRTIQWRGVSTFGDLYLVASGANDTRRLRVNFSYMFGNDQVKGARRRKTGLEDEQGRIKSDN